jgi:Phosphotransferase enzyme family
VVIEVPARPEELPSAPALARSLGRALAPPGDDAIAVEVLERRPNPRMSTFPSELVTCRVPGRGDLRLFCKHAADRGPSGHGHRGGLAYEASVYREVLPRLAPGSPRFRGMDAHRNGTCHLLAIEALEGARRLSKAPQRMEGAASWAGGLHARAERRLQGMPPSLRRHDAAYYAAWAERALRLLPSGARARWVERACTGFGAAAGSLADARPSVAHGEYYPSNVLVRGMRLAPVDWESAAVGAGEIDLATLTENWPGDTVQACERAYRAARWNGSAPGDFEQHVALARVYVHLRWLGDRPERTAREAGRRLPRLRVAAGRAGIV